MIENFIITPHKKGNIVSKRPRSYYTERDNYIKAMTNKEQRFRGWSGFTCKSIDEQIRRASLGYYPTNVIYYD